MDDKFELFENLKQGTKFIYKDEQYIKLPKHVECYGEPANAVNIKTGTMVYFRELSWIDLSTMTLVDSIE